MSARPDRSMLPSNSVADGSMTRAAFSAILETLAARDAPKDVFVVCRTTAFRAMQSARCALWLSVVSAALSPANAANCPVIVLPGLTRGTHFTVVVVDLPSRRIVNFDSNPTGRLPKMVAERLPVALTTIFGLQGEARPFSVHEFGRFDQRNRVDGGVYALLAIEALLRKQDPADAAISANLCYRVAARGARLGDHLCGRLCYRPDYIGQRRLGWANMLSGMERASGLTTDQDP